MRTIFGMPLTAALSKGPKSGTVLCVKVDRKGASLANKSGRIVKPPISTTFRISLADTLAKRVGLANGTYNITISEGKLQFHDGIAVPLVELDPSVELRVV